MDLVAKHMSGELRCPATALIFSWRGSYNKTSRQKICKTYCAVHVVVWLILCFTSLSTAKVIKRLDLSFNTHPVVWRSPGPYLPLLTYKMSERNITIVCGQAVGANQCFISACFVKF